MKRCLPMAVFGCTLLAAGTCFGQAMPGIPHLERRGSVTQLVVDGRPFLALAGELGNNTASTLESMEPVWPRLVSGNLNCVLAAVPWAQVEPEQDRFDFRVVEGLIREARKNNLKLVLLWFGSWKNGLSSYAPYWVKKDFEKYPRIRLCDGKSMELLSIFGEATRDADARAFRALMRRIREVDGKQQASTDVVAVFIASGPEEFYMAGTNGLRIGLTATTPGPPGVGIGDVQVGRFADGRWIVQRQLGGDDTGQVEILSLRPNTVQRVTVYRYQ